MTQYAIIENEEISLIKLKMQVSRIRPDWQLAFTADTVEDCIAFFGDSKSGGVDLVFMDIELDDGNCFDFFRKLSVSGKIFDTPVIFTTSYDQYAIEAFKVNSIDYLLKPIMDNDLQMAIEKWERVKRNGSSIDIAKLLKSYSAVKNPQAKQASRILLTSGDSYQYVEISDIAYFLAEDKAIYTVMKGSGRKRMTDFSSLNDIEPILPQGDFFKISRGVITSIDAISRVSKYFKGRLLVRLKAGDTELEITVTSARKQEFLDWYGYKG